MAHEASRCMLLGWLLLSQDILTPVLVEALSLPLGPSNTDVEGALMWKPGCVTQRFLLSIFLSPGGELSVVFRLPIVSIQNYHPLPYQMNDFGKVWPSFLVTESKSRKFPTDGANVVTSRLW